MLKPSMAKPAKLLAVVAGPTVPVMLNTQLLPHALKSRGVNELPESDVVYE